MKSASLLFIRWSRCLFCSIIEQFCLILKNRRRKGLSQILKGLLIEESYLLAALVRFPFRRADLFVPARLEPLDFICFAPRLFPLRFPRCPLDLLLPPEDFPRLAILSNAIDIQLRRFFFRSTERERNKLEK